MTEQPQQGRQVNLQTAYQTAVDRVHQMTDQLLIAESALKDAERENRQLKEQLAEMNGAEEKSESREATG